MSFAAGTRYGIAQGETTPTILAAWVHGSYNRRNEQSAPGEFLLVLVFTENSLVIFEQCLYGNTLLLNVGEFPLDIHRPHDRWGKDNGKIEWSHLVLWLAELQKTSWITYKVYASMLNHPR